jgi:GNAT superfamily N-acetyltransferase
VKVRSATADDAGFLLDMLVEAYNWSGGQRVTRLDVESNPQLRRYVAGWPRGQDFGLVAVAEDGAPVGAAWARTLSSEEPGYGFVAEDIPEITMAVVASQRGRGIGRRLLEDLIAAAREKGWRAVSLSVEDGTGWCGSTEQSGS